LFCFIKVSNPLLFICIPPLSGIPLTMYVWNGIARKDHSRSEIYRNDALNWRCFALLPSQKRTLLTNGVQTLCPANAHPVLLIANRRRPAKLLKTRGASRHPELARSERRSRRPNTKRAPISTANPDTLSQGGGAGLIPPWPLRIIYSPEGFFRGR
jgi:hypothetical protein